MNIQLDKLEDFRRRVFEMHCEEVWNGRGNKEFSYSTFFNKRTGDFDDPVISDSINDTAVTTTAIFDGPDVVDLVKRLEEDEDLIWVWCHSHVNMGVTPSGQDRKTFSDEQLEMAIISNNQGAMKVIINDGGLKYEIDKFNGDAKVSRNTSGTPQLNGTAKPVYNSAKYY